jgi:hypothetical protein
VFIEIALYVESGLVGGGIVDDDHVVVGVVLVQDGLNVEFIPEISDVVV